MKNIYTRLLNGLSPEELQLFQDSYKASNGELGQEVLYPDTKIMVAENGKPLLFMPIQSCYVMGSLGYKGTSNLQLASAMRQITATLVWESRREGRGDIYFVGGHEMSDSFARHNGFEEVASPVFRMRLNYGK